jgi:HD-like signal output (HDOD) protein
MKGLSDGISVVGRKENAMPTATVNDPGAIVAQAIQSVSSIATLPEVTTQIIKTIEDPRSSVQQLNKIISHDPALVTRILKVVNSAFYGLPGQVASVERAIVMLGLNAVKNIAVAASLGQMFRGVKLCEGFTAKDLWTHCVGVAVASRELAKQNKLPVADEAFLAGMIHDIGLLVALQVWPEKLRVVCEQARSSGREFCQVEREVYGVDHTQLGAGLAAKWSFPKSCQQVVSMHHAPDGAGDVRTLVSVVSAADRLIAGAGIGFNLTRLHGSDTSGSEVAAGVSAESMDQIRPRLGELMSAASMLTA